MEASQTAEIKLRFRISTAYSGDGALASSRHSVSQGAVQKTARHAFFIFFSSAVFYAAPRLTERLEDATNRA